ncbi:MAG: hypothetical protein HKN42_14300 [Granulosicoccus sp.]|nr:hypothetical protein [Granulosicoccus sp.]
MHGVLIGVLTDIDQDGVPCVTYPGNLAVLPIAARVTTAISADAIGSEVALLFENGDITRPIIMGVIQAAPEAHHTPAPVTQVSPPATAREAVEVWSPDDEPEDATELLIDGKRIDLQAREQIVLRCGKSSITMTSAGKVIIRGAYVSTRSSGANRIKGGSVQIN